MADKTTQEIVLKVTGDTKDGERKVKSLLDMLKSGKISVDLDTKGLSSSVDRARKLLDDKLLNKKNKISVDLDLGKMQEQLKSLTSKTQTVKVGVDIAGALKGIETLKKELDKIDGRVLQIKTHTTNTTMTEKRGGRTSQRADEAPKPRGRISQEDEYKSLARRRATSFAKAERAYMERGDSDIVFRNNQRAFQQLTMKMNDVGTKVGAMSQKLAMNRLETMYASRANLPDSNPMKLMIGDAIRETATAMQKAAKQLEIVNPIRAQKVALRDERNEEADWKRGVRLATAGLDRGEKLSATQYLIGQRISALQERASGLVGVQGYEGQLDRTRRKIADLIAKEKDLKQKIAEANAKYSERYAKASISADRSGIKAQTIADIVNFAKNPRGIASSIANRLNQSTRITNNGVGSRVPRTPKQQNQNDYWSGKFNAGRVADYFTTPKGLSNFFANITRFLGRSSKGVGSAGEATAGLVTKLSSLGKVATVTSLALGGITAIGSLLGTGFTALKSVTFGLVDALTDVIETIYNVLKPGLELYSDIQKAQMAIAAGVKTNATIDGRPVTKEEAGSIGKEMVTRAVLDAMESVFDPQELITAMQGTMPMFLNKGMTVEQAYEVTRGVAGVAKLGRLAPNQVLQESRDLAQGSITTKSSQVANMLGITNEDLKQFKGDVDGAFNYLMDKFRNYTDTLKEYAETPVGAFENLKETWNVTLEKMAEQIAPPFANVFKGLSKQFGAIRDQENNLVNSAGYRVDEDGNYVDENGNRTDNPVKGVGEYGYKLSEVMQDIANALKEVIEYGLQAVDGLLKYVGGQEGAKDATLSIVDVIKLMIDAVVWCAERMYDLYQVGKKINQWVSDFMKFLSALGDILNVVGLVLAILNPEWALLALALKFVWDNLNYVTDAFSLVGQSIAITVKALAIVANAFIASLRAVWEYVTNLPKGFSAAKEAFMNEMNNGELAQENAKLKEELENDTAYYRSFHIGEDRDKKEDKEGGYSPWEDYLEGLKKVRKENPNYVDPNSAQGKEKADLKKAIEEAQKALKNKLKELKDELKEKLDELKDELKQVDLKYKQGFMTAREYYTEKARLEKEEAELRVQELKDEIAEIQKTPYEKEEDKSRDLREVQRELRMATRGLDNAARNLSDVSRSMKESDMFTQQYQERARTEGGYTSTGGSQMYSTNEATAYHFLTGQGFSHDIALGIIASLKGEALSNPKDEHMDRYSDGSPAGLATGIAQWRAERREGLFEFARKNGSDPYHILTQLAYLVTELNTTEKENLMAAIAYYNENGKSVAAFTKAFTARVERPAGGWGEGQHRTKFIGEAEQAIKNGVSIGTSDVSASIERSLSEGLRGKTLKYVDQACVEAVVAIGKGFSEALREASQIGPDGIVYTDTLDSFLAGKGIPKEDFDKNTLKPGDIIFFDSNRETNAHVMMYKGDGMITGNSTGKKQVIEQDLDSYLKYAKLTPTFVRKTGEYGLGSGGGINMKPSEYLQEEGSALFDDINKFREEINSLRGTYESKQIGKTEIQLNNLLDKWREERQKAVDKWKDDPAIEEALAAIDNDFKQKIYELQSNTHKRVLQFQLTTQFDENIGWANVGANEEFVNPKGYITMMKRNVDHVFKTASDNMFNIASTIDKLWEDYRQAESVGNLEDSVDIRKTIMEAYNTVHKTFTSWIDKYKDYFEQYSTYLENDPNATDLQKEMGKREIDARKNEYVYKAAVGEMDLNAKEIKKNDDIYQNAISRMAEIDKLLVNINKDTEEYNKLINEKKSLQTQKDISRQILNNLNLRQQELNLTRLQAEQLMKQPDILRDMRRVAKQALEDGLVKFLTDGVTEAENLGQALLNLFTGILKEMQQFFAKRLVGQMMNTWFPWMNETDNGGNRVDRFANQTGYLPAAKMRQDLSNQFPSEGLAGSPFSQPWNKSTLNRNYKPWEGKEAFSVKSGFEKNEVSRAGLLTDFGQNLEQASQSVGNFDFSTKNATNAVSDMAQDVTEEQATQQFATSLGTATTAVNNFSTALSTASVGGVNTVNAATGGFVSGAGTSTSDSIPARLSNGEFVMRAKAVRRMGTNFMNAVNRGDFTRIRASIPKFAEGGIVGDAQQETARGMTNFAKTVGTSVSTTNNMSIAVVDNKEQAMEHFMKTKGQKYILDTQRGAGRAFTQMSFSN